MQAADASYVNRDTDPPAWSKKRVTSPPYQAIPPPPPPPPPPPSSDNTESQTDSIPRLALSRCIAKVILQDKTISRAPSWRPRGLGGEDGTDRCGCCCCCCCCRLESCQCLLACLPCGMEEGVRDGTGGGMGAAHWGRGGGGGGGGGGRAE